MDSEKFIICFARGQLSNRLKSLASSWVLARLSRRYLLVHWPSDQGVLSINEVFSAPDFQVIEMEELTFPKAGTFYYDAVALRTYEPYLFSLGKFMVHRDISEVHRLVDNDSDYIYICQSDFYPHLSSIDLRMFFQECGFGDCINQLVRSFALSNQLSESIPSVHMRGKDFPNRELNFITYLLKIILMIGNRTFFLATDDKEFRLRVTSLFSSCITFDSIVLHDLESQTPIEMKTSPFFLGVIDQLLLSQTKLVIYDKHSTFAHVAKLIGTGDIVYNPKPGICGHVIVLFKSRLNRLVRLFWRLP